MPFQPSRRSVLLASLAIPLASCHKSVGSSNPDTLRIGIAGAPDSYSPLIGQFASAALLFKQLYLPLTDYGPDGGLVPGIAKSWHLSEDRLNWTFDLREDLQWSDGAPITVDDVVATVRAMLNPESLAPDAGDFIFLENAQAVLAGDQPETQLGVAKSGPAQVQFRFALPIGVFPELMREFYPLPARILAENDKWPEPPDFVGSGAYVLQSDTPQEISLAANPHAQHRANCPKVYVQVVEDASTRARMVRAGDLDLAMDPPPSHLPELAQNPELSLHGWDAPKLVYIKPNFSDPVLAHESVRKALSLSVDREFIAHTLMADTARPAWGILPDAPRGPLLAQRRKQAQSLLAAAGFDKGVTLQILHPGGEMERIAVILQQNWANIGITCHLQGSDPQGLYSFIDEGAFTLALASFDRGLKRENWRLIEPFASDGFANNFGWHSLAYDEYVLQTRSENDPQKRDELAHKAAAVLQAQTAVIPLLWQRKYWLARKGVTGFSDVIPPDFWSRLSGATA